MDYDLVVKEEASSEIMEAVFYYEGKKTGLGDLFMQTLNSYLERLKNSPEHFPESSSLSERP